MVNGNISHFKKYILGCIGILLFASCAQVVAPGGGKKDTTAPRVLKYSPDSAALHFNAKSIEIVFDEFIQLKDISNQLIISPPIEKAPEVTVKGKSIVIEFDKKDTLKSNTTYCFSFGNAVIDINEGNVKENFSYIFSTGSYIDSLTVKGKVENAFDHKTEKGVLAMLYSDFSDSVIYKKQPDYFAKTKEDGTFQVNNIRPGKYKILALKDANANYKYDGENESVGFFDSIIDAASNQNIAIALFQEPAKKLFLKRSVHNSYGKIVFIFNKPADSIRIHPVNHAFAENEIMLVHSTNRDTLTYWVKNFDKDSLYLEVNNGSKVMDTIEFKMIKKQDAFKNNRNPLKFSLLSSPNGNQNFDLNSELKLVFNNPIDSILESKFEFKEDSLLFKSIKPLSFQYSNSVGNVLKVGYTEWIELKEKEDSENPGVTSVPRAITLLKLKENTTYHLFIPPGTFTDIFGLKNDSINIKFKTREEKYYGTVKLKVELPGTKSNYIVQLLTEKESLVRENSITKGEIINYDYIYPQKYKIKVIVDENANGKWDTGNLLQKQQAEKVIYFSTPIQVRSNWDLDLEWKVSE